MTSMSVTAIAHDLTHYKRLYREEVKEAGEGGIDVHLRLEWGGTCTIHYGAIFCSPMDWCRWGYGVLHIKSNCRTLARELMDTAWCSVEPPPGPVIWVTPEKRAGFAVVREMYRDMYDTSRDNQEMEEMLRVIADWWEDHGEEVQAKAIRHALDLGWDKRIPGYEVDYFGNLCFKGKQGSQQA